MGTRVWSQDACEISRQEGVASRQETRRPCPDSEKPFFVMNLAYTIHFYANTHKQAVGSYLEGLKLPCQVKRIQF